MMMLLSPGVAATSLCTVFIFERSIQLLRIAQTIEVMMGLIRKWRPCQDMEGARSRNSSARLWEMNRC